MDNQKQNKPAGDTLDTESVCVSEGSLMADPSGGAMSIDSDEGKNGVKKRKEI